MKALKAEWQKHVDAKKHAMLYGKDVPRMPPKDPRLKAIEKREEVDRQRRLERRAEAAQRSGQTKEAKEHYQPGEATLLWRDGASSVEGEVAHPVDTVMAHAWHTHGTRMAHAWHTHGTLMAHSLHAWVGGASRGHGGALLVD